MFKEMTKKIAILFTVMVMAVTMTAPITQINPFIDESYASSDKTAQIVGGKLQLGGQLEKKEDGQESVWNSIFNEYQGVITGLSGIAAITMIVFFIMNFMKLGASAGNPTQRSQALVGLIWTGLAAAGCGGVALFVGFFYNMLNDGETSKS